MECNALSITNFCWLLQKKVNIKSRIEIAIELKIFVRKGLRLDLNWKRLSLKLGLGLGLSLRLNSLNLCSLCNPGNNATEAEARKMEKYRVLIDNGYVFQPVA